MAAHVLLLLSSWIFSILILSSASDTIQASESIEPGHTVVSAGEVFELGFFTPSNSMKQYVGLWYKVSKSTIVTQDGDLNRYIWNEGAKAWNLYVTFQTDNCDKYALCGPYAACNINNSPSCGCLRGFVPKSQEDWSAADWSSGCVRRTPLNCSSGDGFVKHPGLKVPDTQNAASNSSMTLEECRMSCLKNCSCTAYANSDIRDGGSGCWQWFGELIDIREYAEFGQAIFIRLASSEIGQAESIRSKRAVIIASSVSSVVIIVLGLLLTRHVLKKRKQHRQTQGVKGDNKGGGYRSQSHNKNDLKLPLFDLETIAEATDHFSHQNKIGEGGFGPVYKGVLKGGQEIAVKKLSSNSNQGVNELMNEVMFIVKLQHRNLVRLLGCCIQEEKMLIYEYMGNKSLDFFIFDESRSKLLDWDRRFNIINDIARGLLYLHQDSRLRIIHRDLKASNILLDYEMNAKISDFGMAKSIAGNETSSSTTRVVGTYGYMSPEYAIDGLFSVKSDVFSYGVLVLEIVTGKKNRGFQHPDHHLNLVGHAWRLFGKGSFSELIDETISNSTKFAEILRSVHVGLLCVQQRPEDRPSMANVVMMLSSKGELPEPKQPGFFTPRTPPMEATGGSRLNKDDEAVSTNGMSITMLLPR